MIQTHQINSVSKNNFLSLMKLYEKNYYLISNLINLEVINSSSLNKNFESTSVILDKNFFFGLLCI
jgi:hypothetical protein